MLTNTSRMIFCALSLACFSTSAFTSPSPKKVYAHGFGGVTVLPVMDSTANDNVGAVRKDDKAGYNAGLALGYEAGQNRFEIETTYQRASNKNLTINGVTPSKAKGRTSALAFLFNALYDVHQLEPYVHVTPYLGAGVGYAYVITGLDSDPTYNVRLTGASNALAYQGILGFKTPIAEGLDLTADYRIFGTSNVNMTARNNTGTSGTVSHYYLNNLFNIGLTYWFT